MKKLSGAEQFVYALAISSVISGLLYIIGALFYSAGSFWFLNWNLLLSWLPLLFALLLINFIKHKPWISWQAGWFTFLWLVFLPNSFYIISDFVHLRGLESSSELFLVVLLFSFAFNGLILGFTSLYLVHKELAKRLKPQLVYAIVTATLLACSFAVYLGRFLRWSTWDIVGNPIGIIYDVSDRFINPSAYGQTFQTTILFFILLASMYFVLWNMLKAARAHK